MGAGIFSSTTSWVPAQYLDTALVTQIGSAPGAPNLGQPMYLYEGDS